MKTPSFEIEFLRKLGDVELRRIVGDSIVSAVGSTHNTNLESILAELALFKFGFRLFESKTIRLAVIDIMSEEDVITFANQLNLKGASYFDCAKSLRDYFSTSYSEQKSILFIDWIGFSNDYYKKSIEDLRSEVELADAEYGELWALKGFLHSYQKDIKDQVLASLINPGTRLMVQMPTGAGKTFTALETAIDILRRPYQKRFVVWMVNSNELAEQALQSFRDLWKVKGDRSLRLFRVFNKFLPRFSDFTEGGMVFSTYDLFYSVLSNINDKRRDSLLHLIDNSAYLIVDEAHASIAETHEPCVRAFLNNDVTQIVGLSATPIRENVEEANLLRRLYTNNLISIRGISGEVIENPIRFLQENGFLANIKLELLESGVICNEKNESALLDSLAKNSERNEQIVTQIEYANSIAEKTLVFACTKDHVLALYILCKSRNINVGFIVGDVNQSERLGILEEFRNGELNVLINLEILSTGIDLPNVNRLIITRPIKSSVQYSQIVGRALRGPKNGGNKQNTIVNILDNVNYFSDISLMYDSFRHDWE